MSERERKKIYTEREKRKRERERDWQTHRQKDDAWVDIWMDGCKHLMCTKPIAWKKYKYFDNLTRGRQNKYLLLFIAQHCTQSKLLTTNQGLAVFL